METQTKEVTFILPSHVADFIEETRNQLDGQYDEWAATLVRQALDHRGFDQCVAEMEALLVDSSWSFRGEEDRSRFIAPLRVALGKAFDRHQALKAVVISKTAMQAVHA